MKAEIKVELLPEICRTGGGQRPACRRRQQDDVLTYVMLWRIDAGDYAGALEIGRHALRHGWVMPFGNRNVQTVLAEEMADAAQSAMFAATGFDADLLLQTTGSDGTVWICRTSHGRVCMKAIGAVLSESNPASALNHLKPCVTARSPLWREKTNSSWSADCAMTAADRTCPAHWAAQRWRKALPHQNPVHRPLFQEKAA